MLLSDDIEIYSEGNFYRNRLSWRLSWEGDDAGTAVIGIQAITMLEIATLEVGTAAIGMLVFSIRTNLLFGSSINQQI